MPARGRGSQKARAGRRRAITRPRRTHSATEDRRKSVRTNKDPRRTGSPGRVNYGFTGGQYDHAGKVTRGRFARSPRIRTADDRARPRRLRPADGQEPRCALERRHGPRCWPQRGFRCRRLPRSSHAAARSWRSPPAAGTGSSCAGSARPSPGWRRSTSAPTPRPRPMPAPGTTPSATSRRRDRLGFLVVLWQLVRILIRERPDVVVTTGAAPGFVALAAAKLLLGCRTIWIDSIANAERLSSSARAGAPGRRRLADPVGASRAARRAGILGRRALDPPRRPAGQAGPGFLQRRQLRSCPPVVSRAIGCWVHPGAAQ